MADQLATPADLASVLKRDLDLATTTVVLEACTAVVQAAVGQRLVRVVNDEVTIDLDHLDGGHYLYLPERPVVSVASATVAGTLVSDFQAQLSSGRLWRALGWRSATLPYYAAPSQAAVVYTHGYLPSDQRIQLARAATLSLASSMYENSAGVTQERIDDYAVTYDKATAQMAASESLVALLRRQYSRPVRSVTLVTN